MKKLKEEKTKESDKLERKERICPECGKVFFGPIQSLQQHIFRVHTEKGKNISTWSEKTKKRWDRKKEGSPLKGRRFVSSWTSFECSHCGKKKEIRKGMLAAKKKRNKKNLMFCCNKCRLEYNTFRHDKNNLLQDSLLRADFKCEHCNYDKVVNMYYIVAVGKKGYEYSINNTIILCANCRVLWKSKQAAIDKQTRTFYELEDVDVIKDYNIDTDKIFEMIEEIDKYKNIQNEVINE